MLYRITRHTALTSAHRPRLIESTHTTTILTRRALAKVFGLPIIRTSVDHGTAYDIAGKGVAESGSLLEAVKLAARLAHSRSIKQEQTILTAKEQS